MSKFIHLLQLLILLMPPSLNAATCQKQSPAHTVALVELYTSEGCSSCPPADRWLNELTKRYSVDQLVPLSLHVDYWDYIGWQDPFAQAQFSARQTLLTRLSASATSYTPEVFVGMKELRNWWRPSDFEQRLKLINSQPARAAIALKLQAAKPDSLELEVAVSSSERREPRSALQGIVVLYENQLTSHVRAGENHGATLHHEQVVRYASPPFAIDAQTGREKWKQTVAIPAHWQRTKLGMAAFVQDVQTGEVLQAVSMPGCS